MSITASVTKGFRVGSDGKTESKDYTQNARLHISEPIAIAASDYPIACDLDVSEIEALYVSCTTDVTIFTNAAEGGGPNETIALLANTPYIFTADDEAYGAVNIFATDLANLYVTNGSGIAGVLEFDALYDPTP